MTLRLRCDCWVFREWRQFPWLRLCPAFWIHHFQKLESASENWMKQDGHNHLDNTGAESIEGSGEHWKDWSNCNVQPDFP